MMTSHSSYLIEYREAIRRGHDSEGHPVICGRELIDELDRLIADLDDPRYIYDRRDALERMDFMENCIKLTKSPFYGKPMKLMLWQKAFIEVVYSFKMADTGFDRFKKILLLIARKNTKALSLETRVPTPSGDKTMGEIRAGDYVFDEFGKPIKVLETSEIFHNRKCFEVEFEDGEKIIADEHHRWTVQTKGSRRVVEYKPKSERKRNAFSRIDSEGRFVLTTADMLSDFKRPRADGIGVDYKYRVPMGEPLEYPEKELFSPYVLGLWLGDGDRNDNRITTSKEDLPELIKQIESEGIDVFSVKEFSGRLEVRIGSHPEHHKNDVREAFRELNVFRNKHIPEEYFTASVQQRWDLLRGLMDTDGTCSKAGQCSFVQKDERLTLDVSRLLSSLAIKHTVKLTPAKCNGEDYGFVYRISFYVDKGHSCFRYPRKTAKLKDKLSPRMSYKSIVNIAEVDKRDTKCITVDSETGLFVCGERNTVTHNSETCSALGNSEMILGPDGADIVCSSNDDNQASIIFDAIDVMRLMFDPDGLDTHRNQRFIKNKVNGSKIFKLSDRTKNKEGRNIDFAILDEVHEMKDNVILKSIEQSQSLKENPKLIIITTEGFVNEGVLDDLLIQARKIIAGEDDSISAERFLPWLYTQDSEQEVWNNEKSWIKSNPTLGIVKKWDYLREQVDLARKSKADRMFVLSKDFNFKQSNAQAWLMSEDFQYTAKFDPEFFRGSICLGAVDLAETTDLVSAKLLLMRQNDPTKYVVQHYWIPELKLQNSDDRSAGAKYSEWAKDGILTICEGNDVDVSLVADWFYKMYKEYEFRLYKCGYDVKFSKDFLKRMEEYGFDTEIVIQNKLTLSNAMKLVEADFKARRINYNENPIDQWCLSNASMEIDDLGNVMCVKINNQHARRIDGAVTFIILWEIYRRHRSDFTRNAREIFLT